MGGAPMRDSHQVYERWVGALTSISTLTNLNAKAPNLNVRAPTHLSPTW